MMIRLCLTGSGWWSWCGVYLCLQGAICVGVFERDFNIVMEIIDIAMEIINILMEIIEAEGFEVNVQCNLFAVMKLN